MSQNEPYVLIAKLGEGGMAEVFKAVKRGPDAWEKPIALKRILPYLADDESFIRMLSTEAKLQAHLDHPNLVQVLDFFHFGNTYYLAMEYVPGHNYRVVSREAKSQNVVIPWEAHLFILSEMLKGLDFAHKRKGQDGVPLNIVHRDISPQNILVSYNGIVKLSDFGVARGNIERERTKSGILKGKQKYLSPEQIQSKEFDHRTDLFSAGVVLYEFLADLHPFECESEYQTMQKIAITDYRPLNEIRKDLPEKLYEIINVALSNDPKNRYEDAASFRKDLLDVQSSEWLGHGTEKLSEIMARIFPQGDAVQDIPIERTPILSVTGTPIPVVVPPSDSFISGISDIPTIQKPSSKSFAKFPQKWVKYSGFLILILIFWAAFQYRTKTETPTVDNADPSIGSAKDKNQEEIKEPTFSPVPISDKVPEEKVIHPSKDEVSKPVEEVTPTQTPPSPKRLSVKKERKVQTSYGSVEIYGPKGTLVFLGGKNLGRLPLPTQRVPAGDYHFAYVLPSGTKDSKRIEIPKKGSTKIVIPFLR